MTTIGDPLPRVDGVAKVTGTARYSAEFAVPGITYGALVMSTIPSGRVLHMRTVEAEHAPGVLAVITPANAIKLPAPEKRLTLLQDDKVYYQNQPIAIVVAETLEQARYAASLVRPSTTRHRRSSTSKADSRSPTPARTTMSQGIRVGATWRAGCNPRPSASTLLTPRRSTITIPWSRMPLSRTGTATI